MMPSSFLAITFLLAIIIVVSTTTSFPPGIDPLFQEWVKDIQNEGIANSQPAPETLIPLVNIKNGTIRGSETRSVGGEVIYQYLGVPYAKAPVGDLRFKPPQPYEGWGDDIFNATWHPKACPQYLTNLTQANEDCLYLSVYSRVLGVGGGGGVGAELLPVVYFIHGGAFIFGQNSVYDASKLLEERIVLVTVQYRLGPFGFLYTGDNTTSGNNGMKDMVQGLRWIQENIEAFGGDPNQVTIAGESAGAISALYMLVSPIAQGLFHKVVAMSGPPIMEFGLDRNPRDSANRLGRLMNCSTETSQELVDCLMQKDAIPLARGGIAVIMEDFLNFKMLLSGSSPVIEGDIPGAFLPDEPMKLFTEGQIADVPVLMGTVNHEGILPVAAAHYLVLNPQGLLNDTKYIREHLASDMLSTWGINEKNNGAPISKAMISGYLDPGKDRGNFTEIQYQLLDLTTVVFMKAALLRTADILSERLTSVYMYNFEYYNQYGSSLYNLAFNLITLLLGGEKPDIKPGICHADDLIYMFRLPFILGPQDTTFSRSYVNLFTNFIVYGNPTPNASESFPNWPKYNIQGQHYMRLDLPFEVKQDYTSSWKLGMRGVE